MYSELVLFYWLVELPGPGVAGVTPLPLLFLALLLLPTSERAPSARVTGGLAKPI